MYFESRERVSLHWLGLNTIYKMATKATPKKAAPANEKSRCNKGKAERQKVSNYKKGALSDAFFFYVDYNDSLLSFNLIPTPARVLFSK